MALLGNKNKHTPTGMLSPLPAPFTLNPVEFFPPPSVFSPETEFPPTTPIVAAEDGLYGPQTSILFLDGPLFSPSPSPVSVSSSLPSLTPTEKSLDTPPPSPSISNPAPRFVEDDCDDDLGEGDSEYLPGPSRRPVRPRRSRRASSTSSAPKKPKVRKTAKPTRRQRREPQGHRVDPEASHEDAYEAEVEAGPSNSADAPITIIRMALVDRTPSRTPQSNKRIEKANPLMCPIEGCNKVSTLKADVLRHLRSHSEPTIRCHGVRWEDRAKYGLGDETTAHRWPDVEGLWVGGCGRSFTRPDALKRHVLKSVKTHCVSAESSVACQ